MKRIEYKVVREEANGTLFGPGLHYEPRFDHGNWGIAIDHDPFPRNDYYITAVHLETGATMDTRVRGSLGAARKEAGRIATVVRGTMYDYDWKVGE